MMRYGHKPFWRHSHLIMLGRINKSNSFGPSLPCSVNDRLKRSKTLSRKWVAASSSSKKSSMANVCSCTSEAMNISIALGWLLRFALQHQLLTSRILQERQRLYLSVRQSCWDGQFDAIHR